MNKQSAQPVCAAIRIKPTWILAAAGVISITIHAVAHWGCTSEPDLE